MFTKFQLVLYTITRLGVRPAYANPFPESIRRTSGVHRSPNYHLLRLFCLNFPLPLDVLPVSRPCDITTSGHFSGYIRRPFCSTVSTHLLLFVTSFFCNLLEYLVLLTMAESGDQDLAKHPALTSYVTPPVTKPLLDSLNISNPPPEGEARLHWLLDINNQFFCWELQQVVSTISYYYYYIPNLIICLFLT